MMFTAFPLIFDLLRRDSLSDDTIEIYAKISYLIPIFIGLLKLDIGPIFTVISVLPLIILGVDCYIKRSIIYSLTLPFLTTLNTTIITNFLYFGLDNIVTEWSVPGLIGLFALIQIQVISLWLPWRIIHDKPTTAK